MGNDLFNKVIAMSGLDKEVVTDELRRLLGEIGTSPEHVTEDEMRRSIQLYMYHVMMRRTPGSSELLQ